MNAKRPSTPFPRFVEEEDTHDNNSTEVEIESQEDEDYSPIKLTTI